MSGQRRPNILFVFTDQQRWDTLGCYGSPIFEGLTPNLDRLAAEGVVFRHAFTPQPVCGPARACLQTGQYATQTGCFTNCRALPAGAPTIASILSDSGYETSYIGKWHLASNHLATGEESDNFATRPIPPERRGGYRDYWLAAEALEFTSHGYEGYLYDSNCARVDFEGYRVDCLTDFVLQYLRNRTAHSSDRPFFLFVSYIEPHQQNDLNRYIGPIGSKQRFRDYRPPDDLIGAGGHWQREMPDYLGCCWSLDQNMGRILSELRSLGLAEDTLVIYTSDHGNHFGTRNSEAKRSAHDACIRVPLIMRGLDFVGGKKIEQLVSLIDLPPTLLDAAGAMPSPAMRGRAMQSLTRRDAADWPREVFVQVSEDHIARAIRTEKWKYSVWVPSDKPYTVGLRQSGSERYTEQYLYDLVSDPHERRSLVTDPVLTDVRKKLARTLVQRMVEIGEPPPEITGALS